MKITTIERRGKMEKNWEGRKAVSG